MLIFAHRGASAVAPENTLLAMQKALNQGCDGIELDVQQLGNELVVIHDQRVSRTTNGVKLLRNYSLAELQALDAGEGQSIPTLWQVLSLIDGRCLVNIEIKQVQNLNLVQKCIEQAIQHCHFSLPQFIVSSFDHPLLKQFKQLCPQVKVGALTASKPLHYAQFAQQLMAYSVNVDFAFLDLAFVQDAKQRNLKLFVYTVDEAEDLLQLKDWKVDGVFCNNPGHARKVLQQAG
ncbi:glycerophosphodiester phosphodiesterase [Paraglaciecola aestuariivivens]